MRQIVTLVVALLVTASAVAATVPSAADSYVLRDSDVTYMLGKGMSAGELKVLQSKFGNHFLWAQRAGTRYVIRDAEWLREALEVLRRNVAPGPERDARIGSVVDHAVKRGKAERLP
jgi:hypothetical protein